MGQQMQICQWVLLRLMLCQVASSLPHKRSASCDDPSTDSLKNQYIDYISDTDTFPHDSWYMLPYLRNSISNETDIDNIRRELLNNTGNTSCPTEHIPASNELKDRSNCPYYYELNMNVERYPQGLVQAQCRCPRSDGKSCLGSNDITLGCDKVNYSVKVLRKTTNTTADGMCIYKNSFESIAVGCTCARSVSGGEPDGESQTTKAATF